MVAEPASVRDARVWLSALATGLVGDSKRPDLELVITEVVTNAVRHGSPGDEGAGFVPRPGAMASDAHGGFGLFIVEKLTRRWGMTREDHCTRVWFEFDY